MENFLLSSEGELKLCDFGSATTEQITPNVSWSAQQRDLLEDRVRNLVEHSIFLLEIPSFSPETPSIN